MSSETKRFGCGHVRWSPHAECRRCRATREEAEKVEAAARLAAQIAWYEQTGHCGRCGQPGVFCLCRQPCGCHSLHECGSGLVADPAEVFAAAPVSDDQAELFDVKDV